MHPIFKRLCALALRAGTGLLALPALAQPAGWTYVDEVRVFNETAQEVEGYQLPLELDAATMASLGQLRPDAGDLRFGLDVAGTQTLPYWVQSGLGTQRMLVWVRLPRLAASGVTRFYIYRGNPAATHPDAASIESTFLVFNAHASPENNTATLQRGGGKVSMAPHSVRGMRFEARQDLLVVALGKNEPQGTARVVTLWDVPSRTRLMQLPVSGPAGRYGYALAAAPVWLAQGGEYLLTLQQGANEGYYYQQAAQAHPAVQILGARYCNQCDANTFPTLGLPGMQYGYPDIMFLTRRQITPEPNYEYENIIQPPEPPEPEDLE
ncbi:DUF2341 domain-containing protein [Paracidovorax sp. MALMAid1276]|uniref:DUF2341 domain-containing protein n=1 Tax=Paracidovorax sp. MALMAid1276 TaxID=3411631 RepID=UPI003B98FC63